MTRPKDIQLVALDLDGTTLRHDKSISDRVLSTVRQVQAKGVHVVAVTARPPRSGFIFYEKLGLETISVHYNGAMIVDFSGGSAGRSAVVEQGSGHPGQRWAPDYQPMSILRHTAMPAELVKNLVAAARAAEPECIVSLEVWDRWLSDRKEHMYGTGTAAHFEADAIGPLDQFWDQDITKFMLHGPKQMMLRLKSLVEEIAGDQVEITRSDDHLLQIANIAVNKGEALAWVADYYGVPMAQTMAIGDAPNDVEMIKRAGWGVAVANAWPELKAVADEVVGTNEDDGVAGALDSIGR